MSAFRAAAEAFPGCGVEPERLARAEERIRPALSAQETRMVYPAEPYPPPGEVTPPLPAVVPEAYPPPDEGTPPVPAPVPEPGPGPPAPDPDS